MLGVILSGRLSVSAPPGHSGRGGQPRAAQDVDTVCPPRDVAPARGGAGRAEDAPGIDHRVSAP